MRGGGDLTWPCRGVEVVVSGGGFGHVSCFALPAILGCLPCSESFNSSYVFCYERVRSFQDTPSIRGTQRANLMVVNFAWAPIRWTSCTWTSLIQVWRISLLAGIYRAKSGAKVFFKRNRVPMKTHSSWHTASFTGLPCLLLGATWTATT